MGIGGHRMSEVEKLYKIAGVEKQYYYFDSADGNTYTWELNENGNDKHNMCFIGKPKIKDREFTAEKQLELFKWLVKTRPIHITFLIDKWVIEGMVRYGKRYDTFEDALSGYINNIRQTLTDQERTEIRSILNEN